MKKTSSIFFISILFILGIPSVIFSQLSYKISGTVRSTVNNDAIPGAVIIIDNTPKQKTITDKFGGYSFVLPPGRYLIHISHVCFVEKFIEINIDSETNKDIYLENYIKLNDAIVYTNLTLKKQSEEIIGKEKLNLKGLEKTFQANPNLKMVCEWYPTYIRNSGLDPAEFREVIDKYFEFEIIKGDYSENCWNLFCKRNDNAKNIWPIETGNVE